MVVWGREHRPDHALARLQSFGADHRRRRLTEFRWWKRAHVERTIDGDESSDALRMEPRVLANHRRAHTVSDQDDAFRLGFCADGFHGPRKQIHRELAVLGRPALAMPRQIERDDAVLLGEGWNLPGPRRAVARPAMNEHDGAGSGAGG
jgi:hypothetical protein